MENLPKIENGSVLEEPNIKRFIESWGIKSEDLAIIEELTKFPSELIILLLHNVFNMSQERSAQVLEREMAFRKDGGEKRVLKLFQELLGKYGWQVCFQLTRFLEERETQSLMEWKLGRKSN